MAQQSSLPRRLFLLASGGAASSLFLAACASPDQAFIHEPLPAPSPPVKMQRLLLWLPPNDQRLDGANLAARFVSLLAPYGIVMETGRSTRLELDRSADQRATIERFRPTYRLEIDIPEGRTVTQGSVTATSYLVQAVLYRGASGTPLARFHFHARSKQVPRFADQVVEKLKESGYL